MNSTPTPASTDVLYQALAMAAEKITQYKWSSAAQEIDLAYLHFKNHLKGQPYMDLSVLQKSSVLFDYCINEVDAPRARKLLEMGIRPTAGAIFELLAHRKDISGFEKRGLTPDEQTPYYKELISVLLEGGASLNDKIPPPFENLPMAALAGRHHAEGAALCSHLISLGANLDHCSPRLAQDFYKQALLQGCLEAVMLCHEKGVTVVEPYTPLALACYDPKSHPIFEWLLAQGEDFEKPSAPLGNGHPFAYLSAAGESTGSRTYSLEEILNQVLENDFLGDLERLIMEKQHMLIVAREQKLLQKTILQCAQNDSKSDKEKAVSPPEMSLGISSQDHDPKNAPTLRL